MRKFIDIVSLTEGVNDHILYHVMSFVKAEHVAANDRMEARWEHLIDGRKVAGNSFTRNNAFWFADTAYIRLTVNSEALGQRHKIIPLDAEVVHRNTYLPHLSVKPDRHISHDHDVRFAEEFVVGEIKDLHRYVLKVEVREMFVNSIGYRSLLALKQWCEKFSISMDVAEKTKQRCRDLEASWEEDDIAVEPLFGNDHA